MFHQIKSKITKIPNSEIAVSQIIFNGDSFYQLSREAKITRKVELRSYLTKSGELENHDFNSPRSGIEMTKREIKILPK